MKGKMFKRIIGLALTFAMLLTCMVFSPVMVSAAETSTGFQEVDIDFDDYDMEANTYDVKGTVENVNGRKALKMTEGETSYVATGLTAADTGRYELKFSMRPDTKADEYLFAFDGAVPYTGTNAVYRMIFFNTPNAGQIHGWYSGSNAWSTTYNHNRLKTNYVAETWYDVTAVFDLTKRTVDVKIDGDNLGLTANTYQIALPEGAYPEKLIFQSNNKNDVADDSVCYVCDISLKKIKYNDICINFDDKEANTVNPEGISGTVTALNGNNVLKLTEGGTSYIETGIDEFDTDKYILKFSMRPDTKADEYLFAFDGAVPYTGTNAVYRMIFFNTPNAGQIHGWYSGSNAWSTTHSHNRLKTNYVAETWYNVTAVFDLANRTVDVTIDGDNLGLTANTYQIALPDGAYPKKLMIQSTNRNEVEADSVCYIDNISLRKALDDEIDMADYTDTTKPDWMNGTITEVGGRKALKLNSAVSSLPTYFAANDTNKYEIKYSIYPATSTGQYIVSFDGNEQYISGTANTVHYRVLGMNGGNLFGWDKNSNAWIFGWNNNRLAMNYATGQWYDVSMILDHALNCAKVTITSDGKEWSYFMVGIPDAAYIKTLDFRCADGTGTPECYIGDISIKPYRGKYGFMASSDGIFDSAGVEEATNLAGLEEGLSMTAKVNYINPTSSIQNLTCMIAYYDASNKLLSADIIPTTTISANTSGTYLAPFTVPDVTDVKIVKIFMWDNLTNLIPVGSVMKPY